MLKANHFPNRPACHSEFPLQGMRNPLHYSAISISTDWDFDEDCNIVPMFSPPSVVPLVGGRKMLWKILPCDWGIDALCKIICIKPPVTLVLDKI